MTARRPLATTALLGALTLGVLTGCTTGPGEGGDATAPEAGRTGVVAPATATPRPTPSATPRPSSSGTPSPRPTTQEKRMSRSQATTALFEAAASGDVDQARSALRSKPDLEARDAQRRTPLVVATKAKRTRVALLLLDAGADPDAKDAIADSAFLYAGAEGYDEILRATIRHGADVRSTNRFGGTALIPASEHGHTSTVRILINAGVPLDHVNRLGWTAMLEAIVLNDGSADQVDVVRQLVAAGADPGVRDGDGRTPRSLAAARGFDAIVDVIDDADALRERSRRLIDAAREGDEGRVERLLDQHASVATRDRTGATALVAAAYGNHVGVARRLLEAGADPDAKDETVQSAYLVATSEVGDDPRLLRLTLRHGADVRSLDSWKGTGLIRAGERGFAQITEVLLEAGVDVDHVNRIGYTALHEAVILGDGGEPHQRTVAALVRAGADRSVRDPRGQTALDVARARGYATIVGLLD